MSIHVTSSLISTLTAQLTVQWKETREYWRDQKAVEFEREKLELLLAQVTAATEAMEELDRVIRRIRSDCE